MCVCGYDRPRSLNVTVYKKTRHVGGRAQHFYTRFLLPMVITYEYSIFTTVDILSTVDYQFILACCAPCVQDILRIYGTLLCTPLRASH